MQTETTTATGKRISLTPNADVCFLDKTKRNSTEYAKARAAWQQDYALNYAMNQPMAKRTRKQTRDTVIQFLGGKVSKNEEKGYFIVAFPDNSVARL